MIKPKGLNKGDKVAIVSLSSGILGENKVQHELDLGIKRLEERGLQIEFMPNSLKGLEYLKNHPEARAEDLKLAFKDDNIKAIITATGGNDTYKLLPYLLNDSEFISNVRKSPKIFIGFSDTTVNHLMFYKLGLITFYGPAFLTDIAELDSKMLPYTEYYFNQLFDWIDNLEIEISPIWYMDRENYKKTELGKSRIIKPETKGYEILNGLGIVEGELFGGCIETLAKIAGVSDTNIEMSNICKKYKLFPSKEDLKGKILFLETSEAKIPPDELLDILEKFNKLGTFDLIAGVIIGKPIDEVYYEEYKQLYNNFFKRINKPVIYNVNFGHSVPRCIIPYGIKARMDLDNKLINIVDNPIIDKVINIKNR